VNSAREILATPGHVPLIWFSLNLLIYLKYAGEGLFEKGGSYAFRLRLEVEGCRKECFTSLAAWAALLASYRVLIFQVPIQAFAFVEMRFVCELASRGLSPACVMDSSEEEPP
jgi:hypothetical protein